MIQNTINSSSCCCSIQNALQESSGQPTWCVQPCTELSNLLLATFWLSRCPPARGPLTLPEKVFWSSLSFCSCIYCLNGIYLSPGIALADHSQTGVQIVSEKEFSHTFNKCIRQHCSFWSITDTAVAFIQRFLADTGVYHNLLFNREEFGIWIKVGNFIALSRMDFLVHDILP